MAFLTLIVALGFIVLGSWVVYNLPQSACHGDCKQGRECNCDKQAEEAQKKQCTNCGDCKSDCKTKE